MSVVSLRGKGNSMKKRLFIITILLFAKGNLAMEGILPETEFLQASQKEKDELLLQAATKGDENQLQQLLEAKANVNTSTRPVNGSTPLHLAAQKGHSTCVKVLLKKGAKMDAVTAAGSTPLHKAAWHGKIKSLRILLEAKANVNSAEWYGARPLHNAALQGHLSCLQTLLEANATIDALTKNSNTPLYYAVQNNHDKCVKALLRAGANPMIYNAAQNASLHCTQSDKVKKIITSFVYQRPQQVESW